MINKNMDQNPERVSKSLIILSSYQKITSPLKISMFIIFTLIFIYVLNLLHFLQ